MDTVSPSPGMVLQASWTWGPEGHGAILLVTCDRDSPLSPAPDCDEERVFSKEGNAVPVPAPLKKEKNQNCSYCPLFNFSGAQRLAWELAALCPDSAKLLSKLPMWDHAPVLIFSFNYRLEVIPGHREWPKKQQGSAKGCLAARNARLFLENQTTPSQCPSAF